MSTYFMIGQFLPTAHCTCCCCSFRFSVVSSGFPGSEFWVLGLKFLVIVFADCPLLLPLLLVFCSQFSVPGSEFCVLSLKFLVIADYFCFLPLTPIHKIPHFSQSPKGPKDSFGGCLWHNILVIPVYCRQVSQFSFFLSLDADHPILLKAFDSLSGTQYPPHYGLPPGHNLFH